MQVILSDKSVAQLLWSKDHRCTIIFKAISKQLTLPVGIQPTIELVNKLYRGLVP